MNEVTHLIMKALKLDAETAIKVQDEMVIDFSESSERAIIKEAKFCYEFFIQPNL
jgi:hypothetical protein